MNNAANEGSNWLPYPAAMERSGMATKRAVYSQLADYCRQRSGNVTKEERRGDPRRSSGHDMHRDEDRCKHLVETLCPHTSSVTLSRTA